MHALWLQDRQLRLRADVPVPEPAAECTATRPLLFSRSAGNL